ncbi:MAG: ATP-binding cassette domain-containing protein, partial [Muribaculaceae bacterium]|nr:ATP-binding cassette domain-containing protein [Muribaculaceae bacterium]
MKSVLLTIESPELRHRTQLLRNPTPTSIYEGITAIIGPNGSGKSTLGRILEKGWNIATNRITSPRGRLTVKMLEFNDIHSLTGFKAEYYQQRYESTMNDGIPTVADIMGQRLQSADWLRWSRLLDLHGIADKRINYLSSGELRKVLIINQLLELPDLLILDSPYIGLDAASRPSLDMAIQAVADAGTSVLLLIPDRLHRPDYIDHELTMNKGVIGAPFDSDDTPVITSLPGHSPKQFTGPIVELRDCSVTLGGRQVLSGVNWTVCGGETWALTGPNGSGKSTLLSLITADNPQAYRCDIRLFGHKRGTGESIWDIKRRIGYVSPEMHTYFNGGVSTVESIVAHG